MKTAAFLELDRQRSAAYRAAHLAEINARRRGHYAADPEHVKQQVEAYAARNRERILEHKKAYYAANRAEKRAWMAAHRARHPERGHASMRRYRRAHPEVFQASKARHRAWQRRAAGAGVSRAQWVEILRAALGLCVYCSARARLTLDHIVPLSKGGEHDVSNVAPACGACNSSKHDSGLLVWMARRAVSRGVVVA